MFVTYNVHEPSNNFTLPYGVPFTISVDAYSYVGSCNKIYVCNNGSDSNFGDSPDAPLQNINHACFRFSVQWRNYCANVGF